MSWDAGFLLYIQEYIRSDFLNPIMKVLTHSGDKGILLVTLIVILLIIKKTRPIGFMAAVSIAIEALLNNVLLKNIIARTRPYDEIDGLINLVGRQSDYSFPSGHTGAAFAVAGAMLVVALFGLPMIEKTGEFKREDPSLTFKLISVILIMYAPRILKNVCRCPLSHRRYHGTSFRPCNKRHSISCLPGCDKKSSQE